MRKIAILIAFSIFAASSAFAASGAKQTLTLGDTPLAGLSLYGDKSETATTTSPLIGKTSTGVGLGAFTSVTGYSVVTQHKNGTKAFGSSMDSTSIFTYVVSTPGTAVTGPDTADSALFLTTGWTSM